MEQLTPIFEAFDMLDLVLAVFGAIIVSMWWGAGKNIWGLLSGALMGGFIKPLIFMALAGGAFMAVEGDSATSPTLDPQDPIVKFWTK